MKIELEIKQDKFNTSHQKALLNILFTSNWIVTKQRELFEPHGITSQQYNILRILRGQHPNRISGADIKNRMLDKNSDISRLLDRLIGKNLVAKSPCPDDKRASDVSITEEGLTLLKGLDDSISNAGSEILNLSQSEADQLSEMLDKCRS